MDRSQDKMFIDIQEEAIIKTCDEMCVLHPTQVKLNLAIRDLKLERLHKGLNPELTFKDIRLISLRLDKK